MCLGAELSPALSPMHRRLPGWDFGRFSRRECMFFCDV